ncbi:unnamed protein product [Gordionus sp. m RMFG-2023]
MIAVKSSQKFHSTRLKILMDTWFQWCPHETQVFTDAYDISLKDTYQNYESYSINVINTKCPTGHERKDLCCKTGSILDAFYNQFIQDFTVTKSKESIHANIKINNAIEDKEIRINNGNRKKRLTKNWLCLFDDDNYVNVPALDRYLKEVSINMRRMNNGKDSLPDSTEYQYLGKSSIRGPLFLPISSHSLVIPMFSQLGINHLSHPKMKSNQNSSNHGVYFNFATGGAGICLSKSLLLRMASFVKDGRFLSTCETLNLPDDVTLGYIIENFLGVKLTLVSSFNSHLEDLSSIQMANIPHQLTFSYSLNPLNTIQIPLAILATNKAFPKFNVSKDISKLNIILQ